MMYIEPRFLAEARRDLEAERAREFDRLVAERAIKLQGEHQRMESAKQPTDLAVMQRRRDELLARRKASKANPFVTLMAAEDAELDSLINRCGELEQRSRRPGKAA